MERQESEYQYYDDSDEEFVMPESDSEGGSPSAAPAPAVAPAPAPISPPVGESREERIEREFGQVLGSADVAAGRVLCRKSGSDASKWVVGLSRFGEDTEGGAAVDAQLARHRQSHVSTSGLVELDVRFPEEYPAAPPVVRLVRPIMEPCAPGVELGVLPLPLLFPDGWSRAFTMPAVLRWVRAHLAGVAPTPRMGTGSHYPSEAFAAARARLENRERMPKISSISTEKAYVAMSRSFAQAMGVLERFPAQFETSDKVELPGHILEQLMEQQITGNQALTFEITAPSGVKVYCGANFSSPEHNLVILPDWLWAALHSPQCVEVQLTPVELPRALAIKLCAFSSKFAALSVDHTMVLQAALQNYTTLQAGLTIPVRVFEETYHFLVQSVTPSVPAVCPWMGSHFVDLGIKFGAVLAQEGDGGAPAAGAGGAGGTGIPAAPPLTHQTSVGSASGPGEPPAVPALGPRLTSYTSELGAGETPTPNRLARSTTGAGGAAAGDSAEVAAADARQAAAERAAFAAWRRQQTEAQDAVALSAAAGLRVPGYDETQPGGRIKVDLFNPMNNPAVPPQVTLLVNRSTPLEALYAHIADAYAPPHVPFDLFVRGRAPADLALAAEVGPVVGPKHVPRTERLAVGDVGIVGKVLEARLTPKTACDKMLALLEEFGRRQGAETAPRDGEPDPAADAWAAMQRGDEMGPVSTFVINGGTVGLCQRYDCTWLRALQRADVPALQLGADDLTLLRKDVVLGNLQAELI